MLQYCEREGSLDSRIVKTSEITNNIPSLLAEYPSIQTIAFNGRKAEQVFKKHIAPTLGDKLSQITITTLPSSSPAYAAMPFEQKQAQWHIALP